MKRCDAVERFASNPAGHYMAGRTWLIWCWSPELVGNVFWGRATEEDTTALIHAWDFSRRLREYEIVTDFSRVEAIDPIPFDRVRSYVESRSADFAERVRSHALVRPSGFPGAIVAGFLHLFQTPRRWTVAENPQAAFDWLLHKDAGAALAETEALVESLASAAFELARLRAILAQKPSTTLAESSRAMSLSTRTLQRTLREHGVTYRQLQSEQRLELVRQLLASSDEKISEVARRVGLADANQLSRFFQRQTGELPGAYRKRVRGGDMR